MSEFKTEKCEDSKKEDKQESKQESKQEGKKEEGREDKNLKSRGLEEILKEQGKLVLTAEGNSGLHHNFTYCLYFLFFSQSIY